MKDNPNMSARAISVARRIESGAKWLWQKTRRGQKGSDPEWQKEGYPDWMMYLPNPWPPGDDPEDKS